MAGRIKQACRNIKQKASDWHAAQPGQRIKDWARYSRPALWLARKGHNAKERFLDEIEEVGNSFAYDLPNDAKQALLHPIQTFKDVTDEIENRLYLHERYRNWCRRRRLMQKARDSVRLPLYERLADRLRSYHPYVSDGYRSRAEARQGEPLPAPKPRPSATAAANARAAEQPRANEDVGFARPGYDLEAAKMVTWKDFFNFTMPEQPTDKVFGTWGLTKVYKLEDIVVGHNPDYEGNYTQLEDPKDAAILADSLASRIGHTNLVGTLGRWSDYFTPPKEDGDEIVAAYNLESVFHSDYKRHVEYRANTKTGKVAIKYVCDEPVPEEVIAKDLNKLYNALVERKGYFVENAKAGSQKEKAPAEKPADLKNEIKAKDERGSPAMLEYDALPADKKEAVDQLYKTIHEMPVQEFYKGIVPALAAAAA
jgi:hypothetical protein